MFLENKYEVSIHLKTGAFESFYFSDEDEACEFARQMACSGLINSADILYNLDNIRVYNSATDALEAFKLRQTVKGA